VLLQVFDAALNANLSLSDWDIFSENIAMLKWKEEHVYAVEQEWSRWVDRKKKQQAMRNMREEKFERHQPAAAGIVSTE
jgi:hypothetical protein